MCVWTLRIVYCQRRFLDKNAFLSLNPRKKVERNLERWWKNTQVMGSGASLVQEKHVHVYKKESSRFHSSVKSDLDKGMAFLRDVNQFLRDEGEYAHEMRDMFLLNLQENRAIDWADFKPLKRGEWQPREADLSGIGGG